MKTLQEHYNAINIGQGNKAQFVKQARNLFPEYFNQYTNYDNAVSVLKSKQIISETAGGVVAKGFDIYDWKKILAEETKSVEKETSKQVLDAQAHSFNNKDMKNADNVNFNEIMKGFYCEMKDEKNKDKTGDELKAMVVKNLAKDPLYYTKNGMFGEKGVGYTTEAPGLGTPKEPKGKHKASGYGDLNTKTEKVKSNVQDSLGNSEAKTSNPKKVKEMPDKGVTGTEKKMKLQENKETSDEKIARYKKYTYTLDGKEVKPDDIDFYDHILGAKMGDRFYRIGIPSEDGKVKLKLQEDIDEALYQGPSVKIGAGGGLGGKRFIPSVTVLSRDAVDTINAKGAKRLNWSKPHIKIVKSGDGVKLLISKLLVDTIVGSQRGRSKLSLSVSKMGTGITPEEMSELSGEFKKLVKVLSANGKLSQNGDYFLLDVPTKYNEKRNQFEMPLPANVAEGELNENELDQYADMSDSEIIQWAKEDGFDDFVQYDDDGGLYDREGLLKAILGIEESVESTTEQKLRSLIRNIINEELNK